MTKRWTFLFFEIRSHSLQAQTGFKLAIFLQVIDYRDALPCPAHFIDAFNVS
jgi:hypothetical protein